MMTLVPSMGKIWQIWTTFFKKFFISSMCKDGQIFIWMYYRENVKNKIKNFANRDANVKRFTRPTFSAGLNHLWGVFFLSMLQSNDKWNVKASYIGFHNPENFWASKISTSLEISIEWINSNISIIKCLYYGIFE